MRAFSAAFHVSMQRGTRLVAERVRRGSRASPAAPAGARDGPGRRCVICCQRWSVCPASNAIIVQRRDGRSASWRTAHVVVRGGPRSPQHRLDVADPGRVDCSGLRSQVAHRGVDGHRLLERGHVGDDVVRRGAGPALERGSPPASLLRRRPQRVPAGICPLCPDRAGVGPRPGRGWRPSPSAKAAVAGSRAGPPGSAVDRTSPMQRSGGHARRANGDGDLEQRAADPAPARGAGCDAQLDVGQMGVVELRQGDREQCCRPAPVRSRRRCRWHEPVRTVAGQSWRRQPDVRARVSEVGKSGTSWLRASRSTSIAGGSMSPGRRPRRAGATCTPS